MLLSKCGNMLVSGSSDKTIRVWNLTNRNCMNILNGHKKEVWGLDLFNCNRKIISCASDKKIMIWNLNLGNTSIQILEKTLIGHEDGVRGVKLSQDNSFAVSISNDKSIRVWNIYDGTCKHSINGYKQQTLLCMDLSKCGN